MKKPSEFDLVKNTYFANQEHYQSLVGSYIVARNYWRLIAIIALTIALIAVGGVIYFGTKSKETKTVVFKEDGMGGLTFVGIPNTPLKINSKALIANKLTEYVTALYSVPLDKSQKQYNISLLVSMTGENYFNSKVVPIIKDNYLKYASKSVSVHIETVALNSQNVWEIEFSQNSDNKELGVYKTFLTFKQNLNLDSVELMKNNPLGIYITNIENVDRFKINN